MTATVMRPRMKKRKILGVEKTRASRKEAEKVIVPLWPQLDNWRRVLTTNRCWSGC